MQKPDTFDLAILGAGCFATLLVEHLRSLDWRGTIALIDRRTHYDQAQRWCWWRDAQSATNPIPGETKEWDQYVFRTGDGGWQRRSLERWRYVHVDSRLFFSTIHEAWGKADHIDLRLGVEGGEITRASDQTWIISTSLGVLHASTVIDSRSSVLNSPRKQFCPGDGWWQSFEGRVLPTSMPPLDDHTFCLMDLDPDAEAALGFGYLLPLGDNVSLVEYTVFDPIASSRQRLALSLDRYISQLGLGASSQTPIDEEYGWLPMSAEAVPSPKADNPSLGPLRAGVLGGAARPASGYAFARMDRQAAAVAGALARSGDPARALRRATPTWTNRLDAVFLRTLGLHPELALPCFSRLLEGLSGDQMASFMAERPSPHTLAKVLSLLPKRPFLQGVWQQSLRRNAKLCPDLALAVARHLPT